MPAQAPKSVIVRSEADAWKYLGAALRNELPDTTQVVFEGWPNLDIYLDVGDASITPTFMRAFVDLQEAIWRSHALVAHGEANISFLSDEEKASLELEILVRPGSSGFLAAAEEIMQNWAKTGGEKMTAKHYTIVALFGVACFFGSTTWKAHIDGRVEEHKAVLVQEENLKRLETQVKLSHEETERMKLLESAYKKIAALQDVAREAEQARNSFLKNVPPGASADLQGTTITGSVANELAKKPRETLAGNQIEATFTVQRVDARKADGFRVRLLNMSTGQAFTADLPDDIAATTKKVIERAIFDKKPIIAVVDVYKKKRKIERATILNAVAAPADARAELATPKKKKKS
jgi:hypothetical protein